MADERDNKEELNENENEYERAKRVLAEAHLLRREQLCCRLELV